MARSRPVTLISRDEFISRSVLHVAVDGWDFLRTGIFVDKSMEPNLNATRYLLLVCSALIGKKTDSSTCTRGDLRRIMRRLDSSSCYNIHTMSCPIRALGMSICQSTWQQINDLRPSNTRCNANGAPGLRKSYNNHVQTCKYRILIR